MAGLNMDAHEVLTREKFDKLFTDFLMTVNKVGFKIEDVPTSLHPLIPYADMGAA